MVSPCPGKAAAHQTQIPSLLPRPSASPFLLQTQGSDSSQVPGTPRPTPGGWEGVPNPRCPYSRPRRAWARVPPRSLHPRTARPPCSGPHRAAPEEEGCQAALTSSLAKICSLALRGRCDSQQGEVTVTSSLGPVCPVHLWVGGSGDTGGSWRLEPVVRGAVNLASGRRDWGP